MTNKTTNPLHKLAPENWQPKSEEGKLAKQQYLEMLARQKASKVRAKDDEEKLAIAQQLIEEVQRKRQRDYQGEMTEEPQNTETNSDTAKPERSSPVGVSDHPLWR